MRRSVIALAMFLSGILSGSAPAECLDYSAYMHLLSRVDTPGEAGGVALSGAVACAADGDAGLAVVDVTDPARPSILAQVPTAAPAVGVAISGSFAYVTEDLIVYGCLELMDIADPQNAQVVGMAVMPGPARGVAVSGRYAYVACESAGVQVVDVSNPRTPRIISETATPGYAKDVALMETHAYVAGDWAGLQVLDLVDPAAPVVCGGVDTPGQARKVAVSGTHAYVADGDGGLQVIDISVPQAPRIVGQTATEQAAGVTIAGTLAFVADQNTGLEAINVTVPEQPELLGRISTPGGAVGVVVADERAYVAGPSCGLEVIDVANPTCAPVSGLLPGSDMISTAVTGDLLYLTQFGSLEIVDITNPERPALLSSLFLAAGWATAVTVQGGYAYVLWQLSSTPPQPAAFGVVDVSDPSNPSLLSQVWIFGTPAGVAVSGPYAYVTESNGERGSLHVIDIADPRNPRALSSVSLPWGPFGVTVAGRHAYVADDWRGLQVVDIADPEHPVVVGAADTPGYAYGVAISATYALVADSGPGLRVFDISDPSHPTSVAGIDAPGPYEIGMANLNNYAYLATGNEWSGLMQVIDITDPRLPQIYATVPIDGYSFVGVPALSVSDRYVCVTSLYRGVRILSPQCGAPAQAGNNGVIAPVPSLAFAPNPFSQGTSIRFSLSGAARISAAIYDVAGHRVRDLPAGNLSCGFHALWWDGRDDAGRRVPAGIYLTRVSMPAGNRSARVALLR
jgi:hypothetical protein